MLPPRRQSSSGNMVAGVICFVVAFPLFHISGVLSNVLLGYGSSNNHTPLDYLLGFGAIALGVIFIIRGAAPTAELATGADESNPYSRMAVYSVLAPVAIVAAVLALLWSYSIATFSGETIVIDARNVPEGNSISLSAGGEIWRTGGVNLGFEKVDKPYQHKPWESHAEFIVEHPGFTTSAWAAQWVDVEAMLAASRPNSSIMTQRYFKLRLRRRKEAGSSPVIASVQKAKPCPHPDCYEMEADFSSTAKTVQVIFDFKGFPVGEASP